MTVYKQAVCRESVHRVQDEDLADWTAQPPSPEVTAIDLKLMISPAPVSVPLFKKTGSIKPSNTKTLAQISKRKSS